MKSAGRFNLTAALAAAALADLVFHRLIDRLFLPQQPTGLSRVAADIGRFAFHLEGVLGLFLLIASLVLLLRRGDLFPRLTRFTVGGIGLFFACLAAVGIFFLPLPDRFLVHLKTSQAFLAGFIVMAVWRAPRQVRGNVGLSLFALPAILQALALFADRLSWARPFAAELARGGEICGLIAGALSPVLMVPDPATGRRGLAGVAVGIATLGLLLVALVFRFDLVQTLALYGFRLDLPPLATPGAVTFVALVIAAFVGLSMAVVWTLADPGARLVGYGLILVGPAGCQALTPGQVLAATCGLLAIATALAYPASPQPASSPPAPLLGAEAPGL
jgi:hypothetical protein